MGKKKGGSVRIKQMGGGPKGGGALPSMLTNPMEAMMNDPAAQQIHLPPPPDRNYQMFWPLHESLTMKTDGFQVIYPSYMDSTKTVAQGRRIGLEWAVPTPTVSDVSAALQQLQVRHVLQPYKGYSPDCTCQWDNPGRVLVEVVSYKKRELLRELARRIPELPSRLLRLEREAVERQEKAAAEAEAAAKAAAAPKKAVTGHGGKKKGKKGGGSSKRKG